MSADALLAHLDRVKRTGPGRWQARCPAHDDKTPSLSISELDDGRLLVHCFGQECEFRAIVSAAGVDMAEMFPPEPPRAEGFKPVRRPFLPADAFESVRHECTVVALIGADLHKAKAVSNADYQRLWVAVGKLQRIGEVAYGR